MVEKTVRYFKDHMEDFMCARATEDLTETRIVGGPEEWNEFDMPLAELERLAEVGFLVEVDSDPFAVL